MSEYQYYEFQAIDRPLDHAAQDSSRARITATSFINHYEWGDLKGDGTLVRPPPLSDRLWQAAYFAGKTRRLRHAGQPGTLRMRTQELREERERAYAERREAERRRHAAEVDKGRYVRLKALKKCGAAFGRATTRR